MKTLSFAAAILCLFVQSARAETLYMTSLEWPPYSGESLPDQGVNIAVAQAAFKAMGHDLVVEFYPWARAVNLAKQSGSKYVAYLPEYFFETEELAFSEPLGQGPLGLVENSAKPIEWETLDDLERYRIGVVQDYVNTQAFDERVAEGRLTVEAVTSDAQNLLKVAAGRLDAAVIDRKVFDYLLSTEPSLQGLADKVRMNAKLLESKDLHAAFRADAEGQKWLEIFNAGLERIDREAIERAAESR
ncbi:MAG: transporter substrate-binding domain-containing protein [Chromatiaceae bacterium]|nr:transporter substrate-binding domain-containing protein [Chromatiaceae bacterium]